MRLPTASFLTSPRSRIFLAIGGIAMIGLFVKFFWSFFAFEQPLGYDPGMYRYLFVRHAEGVPPFVMADLEPWARGHPLGLFFFTSLALKAGLPVDWLLGWIWNLAPIVLVVAFAGVMGRRHGSLVGLLTLIAALLSVAFFDGFAAMYWKTYASLFWCVLTFDALERRSWWSIPLGILAVATHNQTGLLFGLVFLSWVALPFMPWARSTQKGFLRRKLTMKNVLLYAVIGFLILAVGLAWYFPIWQEAVLTHLPSLFGKDDVAAGSFPPVSFYLRMSGILLLLGAYGLFMNIRKERWTLWQLAVIWSFLFVALRLMFYRRFFLQLDFFLLPFAAIGIADIWSRRRAVRAGLVLALIVQCAIAFQVSLTRGPVLEAQAYDAVTTLSGRVPDDAFIMGLENISVMALRGWLPHHRVGGPGMFDVPWSYEQWEQFLLGTHEERLALLRTIEGPVYLFVTPFFRDYYDEYGEEFLRDPCFVPVEAPFLYRVGCVSASS